MLPSSPSLSVRLPSAPYCRTLRAYVCFEMLRASSHRPQACPGRVADSMTMACPQPTAPCDSKRAVATYQFVVTVMVTTHTDQQFFCCAS